MSEFREALWAFVSANMPATAGHDLDHLRRVEKWAMKIALEEGADLLVVQTAAALHDLVNLPKDHPDRKTASRLSADKAVAWLTTPEVQSLVPGGITENQAKGVWHAIHAHSYSAGVRPETIEAQVVSDADKLDALGAIGIARVFECGGAMGRRTVCASDFFGKEREIDDSVFTVDHFFQKLLGLEVHIHTKTGREEARRRIDVMVRFLDDLAFEVEV